jgi:serine/threonine protein kinase
MTIDHTQSQSDDDVQRAQALSLANTRPPAEIPGYETENLLGRGAYGEVWTAVDRNTGRRVAIKYFLHRSGVDWSLLSREVEKLVYLSADRYVVQLLMVGWDSEPPFYVMEYVENGSLDGYLRSRVPLDAAEATELFRDLAVGLVHAHGKGVLHCDLKPANILLDQDNRPRLADFGQSRLSHEQSPALGTLFYMAPEQADLEAVPDARWDVYALGAIYYRMLTGDPPFRTDHALRRIENAGDLPQRLAAYREVLREAPPPTKHRRIQGIDRRLADIIDRCLTVDPERRFANVQEILDALNVRDAAKRRWPLLLSGFVGPLLLILLMALFGLRGYEHAIQDSENFVSQRARESNEFAAKAFARSIEGEIARYFRVVRVEAEKSELLQRVMPIADSDMVKRLNDPTNTPDEVAAMRPEFFNDPKRLELDRYLQQQLQFYADKLRADDRELKFASILVCDAKGRMLGTAYTGEVEQSSVGGNFAYRSYFHGGSADLKTTEHVTPRQVNPIQDTNLSAAFRSTTQQTWKIAISTPIFRTEGAAEELLGVLALTVNLGDFAYFRSNNRPYRFAALIDGRPGPNFGIVLQHPVLDRINQFSTKDGSNSFTSTEYRVTSEQLRRINQEKNFRYVDPMASAPGGEIYAGEWIAAMEWVRMPSGNDLKDDMIVMVQERMSAATAPVKVLGSRLKREGLWALGGIIAVIFVLWYVVIRVLVEPLPAKGRHELKVES